MQMARFQTEAISLCKMLLWLENVWKAMIGQIAVAVVTTTNLALTVLTVRMQHVSKGSRSKLK